MLTTLREGEDVLGGARKWLICFTVCYTQTWIFDQSDGSARLLRQREGHSAPPTHAYFYTKGVWDYWLQVWPPWHTFHMATLVTACDCYIYIYIYPGLNNSLRALTVNRDSMNRESSQGLSSLLFSCPPYCSFLSYVCCGLSDTCLKGARHPTQHRIVLINSNIWSYLLLNSCLRFWLNKPETNICANY